MCSYQPTMLSSPCLRCWPIFSMLHESFLTDAIFAVIFGVTGHEAIIQTKDLDVYAVGVNSSACLGTGEEASCMEPHRVPELCGKRLSDMAYGLGPHVIVCTKDGELYSWGHNSYAQLGNGNPCIGYSPSRVSCNLDGKRVCKVACGSYHSLALTEDGEVYAWGQNNYGQIGTGGTSNQTVPRKVTACIGGKKVSDIACAPSCSLAVTSSGQVFGWGHNGTGQLGLGNNTNATNPTRVPAFNDIFIKKVAAGATHTLALNDTGEVYAWGGNQYGQLGTGNKNNLMTPVKVTFADSLRFVDIAAVHLSHMSVSASTHGTAFVWGLCRGQTISLPMETKFTCMDDVFAMFSTPGVTYRPLKPEPPATDNLLCMLRKSFDNKETADVEFKVGGRSIYAHKAILKMRCEYFRKMFQDGCWNEDKQQVITITTIDSHVVYRAFLSYFYTDQLEPNLSQDELVCLLDLANESCEWQLRKLCSCALRHLISVENVATLYTVGTKYNAQDLADFALNFAFYHMTAVSQTSSFNDLDEVSLKQMIQELSHLGAFKH